MSRALLLSGLTSLAMLAGGAIALLANYRFLRGMVDNL